MKTFIFTLLGFTFLLSASGTFKAEAGTDAASKAIAPADTISQACSDAEFRQFDYWIGEWTVRSTEGLVIGRSRISRASDGCAILEEWNSARGNNGKSINFYDPDKKMWRQTWVGGSGLILDLAGNPKNGNMTLYGEKKTPDGTARHRIRWTKRPDGRVEQRWDTSTDGGNNWEQAFMGLYEPKK